MVDQGQGVREIINHKLTPISRLIAVTSGKGGVGKTNVSVNLALALINYNQKVALLDADLGLANADIILGVYPRYTLMDVFNGTKKLDEIVINGPLGLKIIAGSSGVYELATMDPLALGRLIDSAIHLDQFLDFLIVDTSAGLNRNVVQFALALDEILVVATSEPSSIADAYGLVKTILHREPDKQIAVVANMVRSPNEGLLVWQKLNLMTTNFLQRELKYAGSVLYDKRVADAVKEQQPFILAYPGCSASRSIRSVAWNLLTQTEHGAASK